jgi:hypothetical protein
LIYLLHQVKWGFAFIILLLLLLHIGQLKFFSWQFLLNSCCVLRYNSGSYSIDMYICTSYGPRYVEDSSEVVNPDIRSGHFFDFSELGGTVYPSIRLRPRWRQD